MRAITIALRADPCSNSCTKRLLNVFTVWLVVTAHHWFRMAVVAFFVLAWIGLLHGD